MLPTARCYCDKIWNNLNGCRAPGAETFTLPYACPMDHIYDLPSWFSGAQGEMPEFREPGFLEDSRVPDAVTSSVGRVVVGRNGDTRAGYPTWSLGAGGGGSFGDGDGGDETPLNLPHGFTGPDAVAALQGLEDKRVIAVDFLGNEGTFCGFGDHAANVRFDKRTHGPLRGDQYYCFTELWQDQGSPRGGGRKGEPYEPQVVLRHCGLMEGEMVGAGRVHPGVLEHITNPEEKCSCEWGFGHPRALEHIANDPAVCKSR